MDGFNRNGWTIWPEYAGNAGKRTLHQDITGVFAVDLHYYDGLRALFEFLKKSVSDEEASAFDEMSKFVAAPSSADIAAAVASAHALVNSPATTAQFRDFAASLQGLDPEVVASIRKAVSGWDKEMGRIAAGIPEMQRIASSIARFYISDKSE